MTVHKYDQNLRKLPSAAPTACPLFNAPGMPVSGSNGYGCLCIGQTCSMFSVTAHLLDVVLEWGAYAEVDKAFAKLEADISVNCTQDWRQSSLLLLRI
jgi:hypothetical protein